MQTQRIPDPSFGAAAKGSEEQQMMQFWDAFISLLESASDIKMFPKHHSGKDSSENRKLHEILFSLSNLGSHIIKNTYWTKAALHGNCADLLSTRKNEYVLNSST